MKTLVCALLLSASAWAGPHVRGVYVGGGYGYYGGPYWGPSWYPGYAYYPAYPGGYVYRSGLGQIKLYADSRDEVLIDGAYAGTVKDLKSIWLRPGTYDLELRSQGRSYFRRVYVLSGKTIKLDERLENRR
jgi:hypothetical protein